jgi:hypothetical protein
MQHEVDCRLRRAEPIALRAPVRRERAHGYSRRRGCCAVARRSRRPACARIAHSPRQPAPAWSSRLNRRAALQPKIALSPARPLRRAAQSRTFAVLGDLAPAQRLDLPLRRAEPQRVGALQYVVGAEPFDQGRHHHRRSDPRSLHEAALRNSRGRVGRADPRPDRALYAAEKVAIAATCRHAQRDGRL